VSAGCISVFRTLEDTKCYAGENATEEVLSTLVYEGSMRLPSLATLPSRQVCNFSTSLIMGDVADNGRLFHFLGFLICLQSQESTTRSMELEELSVDTPKDTDPDPGLSQELMLSFKNSSPELPLPEMVIDSSSDSKTGDETKNS